MNDLNKKLSGEEFDDSIGDLQGEWFGVLEDMEEMTKDIQSVMDKVAVDVPSLEEWRIQILGRKGKMPMLLRGIKDLSAETKQEAGQRANKVRQELEGAYSERLSSLSVIEIKEKSSNVEVSEETSSLGHLHPLSAAILRIHSIFTELGFSLAEGPLAEDTKFAFDMLNIPLEHPARGLMDTFYLEGGQALRPHTSPVQLRSVMENDLIPPFKVYSPGRVFRSERTDASHQHTFYQVEALMVGDSVSVADFKGIVEYLFSTFFNQPTSIRLRPAYFPFVEPGFEVDMQCIFCKQKGCRTCQKSGWIEMMGAGMVHPNVLSNMNIDYEKYQGFAFGVGIDRMTMLLHGIKDVRTFLSGDLRFLRQFY
jgi:phenylalanyl-tRNA synthetase alpha chain